MDELALQQAARAGIKPSLTEFLAWPEDVRERVATVFERHRRALAVSAGVAAHGSLHAARLLADMDQGSNLIQQTLTGLAGAVLEVSA